MAETEIEIGSSLDEVGDAFAAAWTEAEAGRVAEVGRRIHFRDWAALCAVLTADRYDLLRRDEGQAMEDVEAPAELGLIVRAEDGGLTAPLDEIVSTIRFAA